AGALDEIGATVVWCGAATALGFLPMCASHVDVLRDLGRLAVTASVCSAVAALTVVPAVLALAGRGSAERSHAGLRPLLAAVDRLTDRHAGAVLLVGGLVVGTGAIGLTWLTVDQSPWEWFPVDSAVARSAHLIDKQLGGVLPFSIVLQSPN